MSNYARIISNIAIDVVTGNPTQFFHPDIAAQFVPVSDEVEIGWQRDPDTDTWSAPAPVDPQPEQPAEAPNVSPVEFKLLFTPQERVAIKVARATDPVIDDFFEVVEDPRLTHVNLGLQSTQDALAYLETKGLITDERRVQILAGRIQ